MISFWSIIHSFCSSDLYTCLYWFFFRWTVNSDFPWTIWSMYSFCSFLSVKVIWLFFFFIKYNLKKNEKMKDFLLFCLLVCSILSWILVCFYLGPESKLYLLVFLALLVLVIAFRVEHGTEFLILFDHFHLYHLYYY